MKRWVWFVIGGIVLALAAGGVLYGVLSHEEPDFMGVCWENGKVKAYDDPIKSPHPECKTKLQWKKAQLPLTYFIDFGKDHQTYVDSVVKGADMWSREIGVPVFKQVDKAEDAIVVVEWGSVSKGHAGGHTTHSGGPDGPTGAKVVLSEPSDVHAVYRYAAHEWGHVLGLAHDEAPRSIMYPVQPGVTKDLTFVLPSDHDKATLRAALR
jgi:hypothetical protein